MSAHPLPIKGVEFHRETLHSYSEVHRGQAWVYYPKTEAELKTVLTCANQTRRRLTIRSGGHAFDAQSIGTDIVVSMSRFDAICLDADGEHVRVGAGARWGDIVRELRDHHRLPPIMVTTEHASAGGTLAGDCLSRFSTHAGKEGIFIESFKVMLVDGTVVPCSREAPTLGKRLFWGVVGGLGYLGAVFEITYVVYELRAGYGVRTSFTKCRTAEIADKLLERVYLPAQPDGVDPRFRPALYSALDESCPGRAIVMRSTFEPTAERRRMDLFQPKVKRRVLVEWLMGSTRLNSLFWWFAWNWLYRDETREYLDDVEGFTFFMDGNVAAKRASRRWLRRELTTFQQTFVVPADESKPQFGNNLGRWLEHANDVFHAYDAPPTFSDVLYLPKDEAFVLSATAGQEGFAVSYAFQGWSEKKLAKGTAALTQLAEDLRRDFHGRVHLVKNIAATRETLQAMYAEPAETFFALKAEVDPYGTLRNEFLDKTLLPAPQTTLIAPGP